MCSLTAHRSNIITPTADIPNLLVFITSFKVTFCIANVGCHVHIAGLPWKRRQSAHERETVLLILSGFGSLPQVSVTIPALHKVASKHFYAHLTKWAIQ